MRIKSSAIAAMFGMALSSGGAWGEPFAFQGQLNDGGAPADGLYDLEFELFATNAGGSRIGPKVTLNDLQVTNGVFQAELDFGDDVFDGSARWVGISVRDGASGGAYTGLTPRAKVGSAPQASFASRAGEVEGQFWSNLAPGILLFGENEGDGQVFMNLDQAIEPTDVLVVHHSAHGAGGMSVSTWANGMPYYGYATGGFLRAKSYYDPVTDAWVVNKGGSDMLEIDNNDDVVVTNDLIVGGTITVLGGGGESQIGYKSFTPDSIFENFDFNRIYNAFAGAIVSPGTSGYLRVNLDLPHNAQITSIRLEYADRTAATNIRVELWKRNLVSLDYTNDTLGQSAGSDPNMVQVMTIVPTAPILINNIESTYSLRVFSTAGTWPTAGLLGVRNILVEYTYSSLPL